MKNSRTIAELKNEIAKVSDCRPSNIVLAEVYKDNFHKFFVNRSELVSTFHEDDDIFAYIIEPHKSSDTRIAQATTVLVFQCCSFPVFSEDKSRMIFKPQYVSYPFIISLPSVIKYKELYDTLKSRVFDLMEVTSSDEGKKSLYSKEVLEKFSLAILKNGKLENQRLLHMSDDVEIKLEKNTFLSINWNPQGLDKKRRYYNRSKPAEDIVIDSCDASKERIKLDDCFKAFFSQEKLSKEDTWYCPTCKEHRQAMKKMDLWSHTPDVLSITLKRFSHGQKVSTFVEFPVRNLDLSSFVMEKDQKSLKSCTYDLYAVVDHIGRSMVFGHYTASCLNTQTKEWYQYDDDRVSKIDENEIVSGNAYMLFYKRRDPSSNENKSNL
eukprot:TRINITY_DN4721_c0_g1_i3.p1 TRINITY_DN4721_c0_g1~~TRINITY_DN4721_c0_g1_i3.p1  ORF type:complete len:380 (+),score=66.93 TRINITY_DN4721_c0_g1_i3:698-1837(+)